MKENLIIENFTSFIKILLSKWELALAGVPSFSR